MITYYRVSPHSDAVIAEEFPHATAFTLTQPGGKRINQASRSAIYFPTEAEAITYIKARLTHEIKYARITLARAEERLAEFQARYPEAGNEEAAR